MTADERMRETMAASQALARLTYLVETPLLCCCNFLSLLLFLSSLFPHSNFFSCLDFSLLFLLSSLYSFPHSDDSFPCFNLCPLSNAYPRSTSYPRSNSYPHSNSYPCSISYPLSDFYICSNHFLIINPFLVLLSFLILIPGSCSYSRSSLLRRSVCNTSFQNLGRLV